MEFTRRAATTDYNNTNNFISFKISFYYFIILAVNMGLDDQKFISIYKVFILVNCAKVLSFIVINRLYFIISKCENIFYGNQMLSSKVINKDFLHNLWK